MEERNKKMSGAKNEQKKKNAKKAEQFHPRSGVVEERCKKSTTLWSREQKKGCKKIGWLQKKEEW